MKNDSFLNSRTWKGLFALPVCLTVLGSIKPVRAQPTLGTPAPVSNPPDASANQDPSAQTSPTSPSKQSVTEAVRLGDDRYAQADYKGAVEAYSQALQAYEPNAYALYNRANAYRKLEEYDAAIADYTSALKIAPDNLFAYLYRGMALSETKQLEAAIADFTKVVEQNPQHALAFHQRGESYLAKGNSEAATKDFQTAASLYEQEGSFRKQSQVLEQLKKAKSAQSKN